MRQTRRRGLTTTQQSAHDAAYDACDHTITGHYARGAVVADSRGQTWRVATYGIRYHEDVSEALYGVQVCRSPKGWAETRLLRETIERIRMTGTPDIGSRSGSVVSQQAQPFGAGIAQWQDNKAQSLATFPTLTVSEGGIISVVCPIYDDSPILAWIADARLAAQLVRAIAAYPTPLLLPIVSVRERQMHLTITSEDSRYAAYAAGRGAEIVPDGLMLPRPEWRRIKATLVAQ